MATREYELIIRVRAKMETKSEIAAKRHGHCFAEIIRDKILKVETKGVLGEAEVVSCEIKKEIRVY